jgi:hypothetical protein
VQIGKLDAQCQGPEIWSRESTGSGAFIGVKSCGSQTTDLISYVSINAGVLAAAPCDACAGLLTNGAHDECTGPRVGRGLYDQQLYLCQANKFWGSTR